ncbi:hypothetical protein HTZ84_09655 [Haloterrigena sp. SYSU A558-1]|uniref:Uncharacterized protein n=1 Tax=Haloterrigena gelatinilytica TaxID=2741724 RepID=A0ABX2LIF7_9EURY|nr:hypothetical protein [Haloterrigena gelatinilytica]NUC72571.1 hypothetical protein [Haloterrigena gelatinilytica]
MNLEDTLPDDVKDELNEATEKSKAEKERAARKKRRAKTKYGHLMGDDDE